MNRSRISQTTFDRSQSMMPTTNTSKKQINIPTVPHTIGMRPTIDYK